jgi:isoleucyl-tRNA synthetase
MSRATRSGKKMHPVPSLDANYDWKLIEKTVREFYSKKDPRRQVSRRVGKKKPVGYVEGPPTLNGPPHMGAVRGRTMKDLYYRYSVLKGDNVVFRGGWDTQGLPVELQAEKELGLSGDKWEALKKVGVARLVEACKALVGKYQKDWLECDTLLGLLLDHDRAYVTYRDEYIEREWSYLREAWAAGLLGEGYKVVPYCPSCQTALSHAEVTEGGYENLEDPSLYYKVRIEDGAQLVVWTTMPFTVVTDEMVGVHPQAEYEYVRVGGETWVVGAERKGGLAEELGVQFGETVKRVRGSELDGLRYAHPLLARIPGLSKIAAQGKIHTVVAEDFVDTKTGTGLVHLAPANGEDDFRVAQERGLPIFAPFDDQVRFTEDAGDFAGLFARDSDAKVVEMLRETGSLVSAGKLMHDYPVCWRSGHRLVWLVRREYFYWVDKVRDDLVKAAESVEYYFEAPRNRFVEFVRDSRPWCITRERIWGAPLPVWACPECGGRVAAFSRKEIVSKAADLPDGPEFELHRPWIDRVTLRCPDCGSEAHREPFVLDTWHNSGSAPYASFTDKEYESLVPVRFLTEGIDQTRGWAYTLLVLNVLRTGRPLAPFEAFLFQGHVLDAEGRKMSKSLGNVVPGLGVLRTSSADLARFYLMWKASPEDPLSLDQREMTARPYQVLNTLYHMHVFLGQNGSLDGYDPRKHSVEWAAKSGKLTKADKWLLAKLIKTESAVLRSFDRCRFNEGCKAIEEFVITHLSQSYIRQVRQELWKDDPKEKKRRLSVHAVLGHSLRSVDALMHPVSPFVTEYLHQSLFAARPWTEALMVEGLPGPTKIAGAADAEAAVGLALAVEEACNSARTKAKLKRRWPLKKLWVLPPPAASKLFPQASRAAANLCNVKRVVLAERVADFPAEFELVPNRSKVGALFKGDTGRVLGALKPLKGESAMKARWSGKPVKVDTSAGSFDVPMAAFELSVRPMDGKEVAEKEGLLVALDTARDPELVAEGLIRDIARRLQALRKERGFNPTQVLPRAAVAGLDEAETEIVRANAKKLAFLVRVRRAEALAEKGAGAGWEEEDLDGRPVYLNVG